MRKYLLFTVAMLLSSQVHAATRELIESVKQNNLPEVLELLDSGEDVNAKNEQGNTALHYAVAMDNADMTQVLLAYGADLNAANSKGWTPLSIAEKKKVKNAGPVIAKALQDLKEKNMPKIAQNTEEKKVETVAEVVSVVEQNPVVEPKNTPQQDTEKQISQLQQAAKNARIARATAEEKAKILENKNKDLETRIKQLEAKLASQQKENATVAKPAPKQPAQAQKTVQKTPTPAKKVVLQKSNLNGKIYAGDEEIVYCLDYLGHGENESMLRGAGFFAASAGISEKRYKEIVNEVDTYLENAKADNLAQRNKDCSRIITPKDINKQNQIIRSINHGIGI